MARINIIKCDVCGKETRDDVDKENYNNDYCSIKLSFRRYGETSIGKLRKFRLYEEEHTLCESCLKKIGVVKKEEEQPEKDASQTLLYEIVREMIEECVENRD